MAQSLPMTMKGVLHNFNKGSLKLLDSVPLPTLNNGEHLIKVGAAAITNGELTWPRPPELNESYPGVEAAGTVVTAPSGSRFKPGSRIYFRTTYPKAGSMREYSTAVESELAHMPSNLSFTEAAAVPVSALTAWQALFTKVGFNAAFDQVNRGAQQSKQRVFINGASGGVGLWATQLASTAGFEVVGTSTNEELVQRCGAREVINYKKTSISEWLGTHAERFDLVLDYVGGASLKEAWSAAKEHGLVISVVPPADMQWKWDLDRPEGVSPTVTGKFFVMEPLGTQLEQISELINEGRVRPVVDSTFSLEEYEKAFQRVASGRAVGKVIVKIGSED